MIACSEAARQLWEYLDGVVDDTQRESIEEHLSFCRRCCGEVELAAELRGLLAEQSQPELAGDVRARLTQTLDNLEPRS